MTLNRITRIFAGGIGTAAPIQKVPRLVAAPVPFAPLKGGNPMAPVLGVLALWVLFGGTHVMLASGRVRAALVGRSASGASC